MITLSEMFVSIQGEGPFTGHPAFFIRAGGCNLKCPGFGTNGCDSNFSVDASNKSKWTTFDSPIALSQAIAQSVQDSGRELPDLTVFTGGEPTLQPMLMAYAATISDITKVQIETNGLRLHKMMLNAFNWDNTTVVVSPKLSNAGYGDWKKSYEEVFTLVCPSNFYFKFVVGNEDDVKEVVSFAEYFQLNKEKVYLMPLGANNEELAKTSEFVWNKCVELGFKFSDRMHIRVFNDKRGV